MVLVSVSTGPLGYDVGRSLADSMGHMCLRSPDMAKMDPVPPIWLELCGMSMCRMLEDMHVSDASDAGSISPWRPLHDVGWCATTGAAR
jgi:hypothetical protein